MDNCWHVSRHHDTYAATTNSVPMSCRGGVQKNGLPDFHHGILSWSGHVVFWVLATARGILVELWHDLRPCFVDYFPIYWYTYKYTCNAYVVQCSGIVSTATYYTELQYMDTQVYRGIHRYYSSIHRQTPCIHTHNSDTVKQC